MKMSSIKIPIGSSEGIQLEFKSAAALTQSSSIAREAVGMLNERGGAIWIGVLENNGIATSIDPIDDADTAAGALRDSLIDLIEPTPANSELAVEVVDDVTLRVVLKPQQQRKPYALLKGGARHYVVRVADRNRPMTRDEIAKLFHDTSGASELEATRQRLLEVKNSLVKEAAERFWIRYESLVECDIDPQNPKLESYLREPGVTGNRQYGWTFVVPDKRPLLSKGRLWTCIEDYMEVSIYRTGGIELIGKMEMLHHKGEPKEIWSLTLMEYCASVARLAGKVYTNHSDLKPEDTVLVDLAFINVREWGLKPGSPRSLNYMMEDLSYFSEMRDLVWNDPISVTINDLAEYPDYVAFRLIRRVFEAFGYREEAIPSEYNREEKRIMWPG